MGSEFGIAHNLVCDSRTVDWRIAVHRTNDDLDLRHAPRRFLLVLTNQGKRADTFAVQSHVFGKALRQTEVVTGLDEMAHTERVSGKVSRSEALIGHVEIGEEFAFLDKLRDFLPLFLGGVDTGWIVGTRVQEYDMTFGDFL